VTLLVWLAASSLIWGAVLWGAAIALQSGNDLSGRARQWIWRGAAVLLIMPWLAVPVVGALAPDLSGSVAPPAEFSMAPVLADAPVTVAAMNMAAVEMVERAEPAIVIPWIEILFAAVTGGWLLRLVAASRAARHLGRIISESRPGEGASLATLARWSRVLGLRRAPELRVVSASMSPFSTGVRKPLVCLPEGIEQTMHAQTLDLVVGHECIHVARGDGWRRPLERSIADIMWFNPFAWAIRRELDLARELACDEAVVAASSQRKAYARTLRVVAGMAAALPASAPAASMSLSGSGRLLAMRMKRTLDSAARRPAKAAIAGAVMLAFAATPMAIAQAILIEAVQPPDAPPAPPAPSVATPAQAPQPPVAPKAPEYVQLSPDGTVRAGFPARVVEIGGNEAKGYRVKLVQASKNGAGETCAAKIDGLTRINVAKDQVLGKGAVIGERNGSGTLNVAVSCSDKTDANGWPIGKADPPPAPPTPPAAPSPVPAVSPLSAPSPVRGVTPVATPSPRPLAAPRAARSAAPTVTLTPTPETPVTPRTGVTPVTPTTPTITPTPPVAPALERIQYTNGASERIISGIVVEGNDSIDAQTIINHVLVRPGEALDQGKLRESVRSLSATGLFSDVRFQLRGAELVVRVTEKGSVWKLEDAPSAVIAAPARFTSDYGYRTDPFSKETTFHEGVDIAAARGTPVRTPGAGVVTFAGPRGNYGNVVEVEFDENYRARFGHLNEISVEQGEALDAGDVVGTVGSSGRDGGAHLHFEIYRNGRSDDPRKVQGLTLITGQ
jgi:murein DD-endopeptidase MepM/ murein hydrolase activator NlpD/beta-lactamase regulating signal transducer with metallopeptidase domain